MRIVMMGPPGSGKGTRAHIISELYGIPVITTGDMLRGAVREKTEYGLEAKVYMDRGDLVPDSIVNGIVKDRMGKPDLANGFILDGFPRSVNQADALDEILKKKDVELTHVLSVVLSDKVIIERLSKRRSCPDCNEIYHLVSKPPKKEGICDKCGAKLILRKDDKKTVIRYRLLVYKETTHQLLERYEKMGLVVDTDGEIPFDELHDHLKKLLG
ncbi:adenylate kinase [Candidatus Bathyarchaeota archaeon]|nr:adenylate kinase [Candidatus Bathyarchaeota archaeon]MBT7347788.1 adenylate kinase [Candidatus Bathyarchaeota archaeon]